MKILAAVILVCSVLCATATFHSKQNEVEPKPDIFGSLIALKKNLFGGLKGGKGESSHGSGSASGGASIGGVDNGYNYPPPAPKPVYGPPIALPAPAPRPVYIPPPSLPPPVPRPVYGPPHAAPISISSSGASAAGETSSGHGSGNGHSSGGGHGNIFKSFR